MKFKYSGKYFSREQLETIYKEVGREGVDEFLKDYRGYLKIIPNYDEYLLYIVHLNYVSPKDFKVHYKGWWKSGKSDIDASGSLSISDFDIVKKFIEYEPKRVVDPLLDPFGEEYWD